MRSNKHWMAVGLTSLLVFSAGMPLWVVAEPPMTHVTVATAAGERGDEQRIDELVQMLAAARLKLETMSPTGSTTRLQALERRALEQEAIRSKLQTMTLTVAEQDRMLADLRKQLESGQAELARMAVVTNAMANQITLLEKEIEPLKRSLKLLRLGKYEYYEVLEGDTCESVAAKPKIFGDPAKHNLIRQANRSAIENLDALEPGQILIIPRLGEGDSLEF